MTPAVEAVKKGPKKSSASSIVCTIDSPHIDVAMTQRPPAVTTAGSVLIHAFFEEARTAVRWLAAEPGFSYDETLEALVASRLRAVTPEEVLRGSSYARDAE